MIPAPTPSDSPDVVRLLVGAAAVVLSPTAFVALVKAIFNLGEMSKALKTAVTTLETISETLSTHGERLAAVEAEVDNLKNQPPAQAPSSAFVPGVPSVIRRPS